MEVAREQSPVQIRVRVRLAMPQKRRRNEPSHKNKTIFVGTN